MACGCHRPPFDHRDFQSTNLVVDAAGVVRLVDLATLRRGFSLYDLASLAFDIYLPLAAG